MTSMVVAAYLGRVDYGAALDLQQRLVVRRKAGEVGDHLLLLEHPPVITLGRRGAEADILASPEELKERGIAVYHVDRGGQATCHGPGQLVGYPILDLGPRRGPADYVHALEDVLLHTVASYGIRGERVADHPGVWVGGAKLAAIGVRISSGVTSHGFALNVDPDLNLFATIVPCGTPGLQVASIERLTPSAPPLVEVAQQVTQAFGAVFAVKVSWRLACEVWEAARLPSDAVAVGAAPVSFPAP